MGIKKPIQVNTVARESDLEVPSATRLYPLGTQVTIVDANSGTNQAYVSVLEYAVASEALIQYAPYVLKSTTSGLVAGIQTTGGGTSYGYARVIVPQTAVANGYYFFGVVRGCCTAAYTGVAGSVFGAASNHGGTFKLMTSATTFSPNTVGASAATAYSYQRNVLACAYALPHSTVAPLTYPLASVYLFGDAVINANAAAGIV